MFDESAVSWLVAKLGNEIRKINTAIKFQMKFRHLARRFCIYREH